MASFESCVYGARDRGEISAEEADQIVARWRALLLTNPPAVARTQLQKEMDFAAFRSKRMAALSIAAQDRINKHVVNFRDAYGRPDAFKAAWALFEDFGYSGHPSVRFITEAITGMANGRIADALDHFRRKTITSNLSVVGGRQNAGQIGELQRAMFDEPNVSPQIKEFADKILDTMNWLRLMHNEVSADGIPYLKDWGGPQAHSQEAVQRAGGFTKDPNKARDHWSRFIDPLLDWTKMRDGLTGELFPAVPSDARRMSILSHAWDGIVTNGGVGNTPLARRIGGGAMANNRSDHRYFVFKDADAKTKYSREFGEGDSLTQIANHIRGMAADIAMMKIFGPNPKGQIEWLKQLVEQEGYKHATGKPSLVASYAPITVMQKAERAKKIIDGYYETARGNGVAQGNLAHVGTILQNDALGSLLGKSVVAHMISNPIIQYQARKLGGIPRLMVLPHVLRAYSKTSKAELLRAGLNLEEGAFRLGQGARQLSALHKIANFTRWWPDRITHTTGLTPAVEANRTAFLQDMMGFIADLKPTPWANLPERVRSKMTGYGLEERDWRLIQMAESYEPDVGSAPWMRWIEIADTAEQDPEAVLRLYGRTDLAQQVGAGGTIGPAAYKEAQKIAFAAALRYQGYLFGEREVAVPTRAWWLGARLPVGSGPGSFLARSPLFAKSFIASMTLTQALALNREWAKRSKPGSIAYAASFILSMWIAGTMVHIIKQMLAGKDPPPLDPDTREGLATLIQGGMTGGSFGIFGDYLASNVNSYGRGPLESFAGPVAGTLVDAAGLADTLRKRATSPTKFRSPISEVFADMLVNALRYRTPILSTHWLLQSAYNRMLLDQLQYQTDPDAHTKWRRQELNAEKRGQHFWWRPGEVTPDRGPDLTLPFTAAQPWGG